MNNENIDNKKLHSLNPLNVGDKAIIAYNDHYEDMIDVGQEVVIVKVVRKGEQHPGIPEPWPCSEDHYWINEVGMSRYAGLTRNTFK